MVDRPPDNPTPATGDTDGHLRPEVLSAYIDDQLTPAEHAAATAHLAACLICQRHLAELRTTVRLLHGLPQYRPRRSFALDPVQAGAARPVRGGSRFGRLLPVMRVATVVVAVLLVAVIAGDLIDQSGTGGTKHAAAPNTGGAPALERAGGTKPAATASHQQNAAIPAATHPAAAGSDQAPAAAAPARTPAAVFGARAPATTPAPPTASPAATSAAATPAAVATPGAARAGTEGSEHHRPSLWRVAEIVLGVILVWLIVSWIGLTRLRNRPRGPE